MASVSVISAAAITAPMFRYESALRGGPMQMSSSANLTCRESASAVEYTATVWMPSSRQAQMIRRAISPRLAIRIFLNIGRTGARSCRRGFADLEQRLPVFHRLPVRHERLEDLAVAVRLDLVHQFHRLDDAQDLSLLDLVADLHERARPGRAGAVEGADDRRLHQVEIGGFDHRGAGRRRLHGLLRRHRSGCRDARRTVRDGAPLHQLDLEAVALQLELDEARGFDVLHQLLDFTVQTSSVHARSPEFRGGPRDPRPDGRIRPSAS